EMRIPVRRVDECKQVHLLARAPQLPGNFIRHGAAVAESAQEIRPHRLDRADLAQDVLRDPFDGSGIPRAGGADGVHALPGIELAGNRLDVEAAAGKVAVHVEEGRAAISLADLED